ncbi:MAG: tetratricopeptide repeat protein, partial [Chlorobiaceae bacterium]|nr:tetratricopeptide repeat protein [Chlorobiaceae bacterium]
GKFEMAISSFDNVIAIKPDLAEAYSNRGNAFLGLKQTEEAIASYDKAIAIRPDYHLAHFNRANALQKLDKYDEAVASFDIAITINPDLTQAWANRGNALKKLRKFNEAVASYDKAIAIKPGFAEAHYNRGAALMELQQQGAAIESFDKAISLNPLYHEAYANRGDALKALKRPEAALECFERAIAIKPDFAEAYSNRGLLLQELNHFDAALTSFERAIAIKPDFAEAYSNRGVLLEKLKQLDEALACFDKAIALKPDFAEAYWNKSVVLLLKGELRPGWELYEWRWKRETVVVPKRSFTRPLWLGKESISGKTILLYSEQGFGDTIQFCRYTTLVAGLGAKVILESEMPLAALLKQLDGLSELVVKGSSLPDFDFHCPLLSLPLAFNTDLSSIPYPRRYLKSDPDKLEHWKKRLGDKTTPRVGLVWSGNSAHSNDVNRSIPLSTMRKHLPEGFTYVSLQKEVRQSDNPTLESNPGILHFGDELEDFTDAAALCDLMDVVITVDTGIAHLNAALGNPTWVLLPFSPDWRWMLDRVDSPWYSGVRLFRQQEQNDWSGAFGMLNSAMLTFYGK